MARPMGESKPEGLRVDFDRRLKLEFHGSKVTSDGRGGGTIPVTVKIGYCRCRFEGYLGNVSKEGTMALPEVGSTPPAFTLPDQDGKHVSLADYAGRNVLIWFFPRAFGGG